MSFKVNLDYQHGLFDGPQIEARKRIIERNKAIVAATSKLVRESILVMEGWFCSRDIWIVNGWSNLDVRPVLEELVDAGVLENAKRYYGPHKAGHPDYRGFKSYYRLTSHDQHH
ncbi:hypothetical protein [uncultured Amphritea sp.]|uniref:hypothetical protein n=1 Tax=uncultured Amphritea sp. TaxID=981605 RepID=UPI0026196612|nr:hypothetical protein [uncultured Amphritea sp.]